MLRRPQVVRVARRELYKMIGRSVPWSLAALIAMVAATVQATEPSCGGRLIEVATIDELRQAILEANEKTIPPGSVIRMKAGDYFADDAKRPLSFKNIIATTEDCPLTVEGEGEATVVRGEPINDEDYRLSVELFSRLEGIAEPLAEVRPSPPRPLDNLDRIELLEELDEARESGALPGLIELLGFPLELGLKCFKIKRSNWIRILNLKIQDCWPAALYVRDSSYVSFVDNIVEGSSFAVVAFGDSHHILLEHNVWRQGDDRVVKLNIWAGVPWGVSHHGTRAYYNGALFGAKEIPGGVVIRNNEVRNAYNVVHTKSKDCEGRPTCDKNTNVEIYDNDFERIRDNIVEPEFYAANWWTYRNRIKNAHAWFSFDGVSGGPMYFFGNTGWFDQMPAAACKDSDWPDEDHTSGNEMTCATSRVGRVMKFDLDRRSTAWSHPIYVFNNSWYLRAPLAGLGSGGPVHHWNNAIEFCAPDPPYRGRGDPLQTCEAQHFFDAERGTYSYDWNPTNDFHHDLSNHGLFPDELRRAGYAVNGIRERDLGFEKGDDGRFALRANSPARDKGCTVGWARNTSHIMECRTVAGSNPPDVGAYEGDRPTTGPAYRHFSADGRLDRPFVERPRIVQSDWAQTGGTLRITVAFSVPIRFARSPIPAVVVLDDGQRFETGCRLDAVDAAKLACEFSDPRLAAVGPTRLLLPRKIYRRGTDANTESNRITLWARTDPRIGFAD